MQLSKMTVEVLKNFANINQNLVINTGKKIETINSSKDVMGVFEGEDEFDEKVAIFNLNEFLGALSAFESPQLDLGPKSLTIKQGKQKLNYVYADESLLIVPPSKGIKFPTAVNVKLEISASTLDKIMKMAGILSVEDFSIIGDGKKVMLKVFDSKNPSSNGFEIDTDVATTKTFNVDFKIDRLRLVPGDYSIEIATGISKFSHTEISLIYYIAVEQTSTF